MSTKLKLLENLKQLNLFKYRYKLKTSFTNFRKNRYIGNEISFEEDYIVFYCNFIKKQMKVDDDLIIIDRLKLLFSFFFKTNVLSSCCVLLLLGLFVMSNFFIREVKFTNENTYNYDVYQDVVTNIKSIGPFKKLTANLNDLTNTLREKHYNYAYIGLRRQGGTLYIDIEEKEKYPSLINNQNKPCDLISSVDGKVVGLEIQKGIPIVNIEQIIKKGDVLVTGNVNYQIDPNNLTNLVHSKGIVLIECAIYEQVIVKKKYEYDYLTPNVKKQYRFLLFNNIIGNNRMDDNYNKIIKYNVFNLFNIIKIEQNHLYFVEKKVKEVSLEEAKIISEEKLFSSFSFNKTSDNEKILFVKFINMKETEEQYSFNYLVKYVKNATQIKYY